MFNILENKTEKSFVFFFNKKRKFFSAPPSQFHSPKRTFFSFLRNWEEVYFRMKAHTQTMSVGIWRRKSTENL
jgi:hypothetical protein